MGGGKSKNLVYSVNVPETDEIEYSPVLRHPDAKDVIITPTIWGCSLFCPLFQKIVQKNHSKPFLGFRPFESSDYEWLSYSKTLTFLSQISRSLDSLQLKPDIYLSSEFQKTFSLLGFFGHSKVEWLLLLIACMRTNIVTVGLFDNFESFVGWAEELELKYLCTDSSKLETIRQGISSGILSLEIIICFDQVSQECKDLFADIHVRLLSFENFVRGDSSCGVSNVTPDDPCFLALTSGTTGPAKFCVVSHSNLMSNLSASLYLAQTITNEETYLSYLNFSLLGEILFIFLLAASEGRVGLARSPSSLSSDAQVLKPTMMLVVPRILEYIHDLIKSKVENLSGVSRSLYNRAFATKLKNYERTGALKHKIWDALVFGKAKNVLGGHLKLIVTGISMCPPDLVRFVRIVLGCDVLEGYGIIEAGISNFVSQPGDVLTGHIGGPLMNLEARLHYTGLLFDELSHYYGELYVRGPGVCSRYYKKGDVIHRNGWMATGDLVAIIPETGAFTFIDRIENIFKSRSGKCVCLQKLEVLYRTSKAVAQICCFSDIKIEGIIAVVVPDLEFVRTKWKTGNAERFCKSEEFSQAMIREFLVIERVYKLRPHEKVVKIVVELEPWTSEELVTPTLKIKRFMIRLKYADQIDKVIKDYISDF